jgi:hypothetical protein
MRTLIFAGAIAMLAAPVAINAQTAGTPPADPTGSNTASANLPPPTGPNSTMSAPEPTPPTSDAAGPDMTPTATAGGASNASPPAATPKSYPVCSKTVHDQCRNRGGR